MTMLLQLLVCLIVSPAFSLQIFSTTSTLSCTVSSTSCQSSSPIKSLVSPLLTKHTLILITNASVDLSGDTWKSKYIGSANLNLDKVKGFANDEEFLEWVKNGQDTRKLEGTNESVGKKLIAQLKSKDVGMLWVWNKEASSKKETSGTKEESKKDKDGGNKNNGTASAAKKGGMVLEELEVGGLTSLLVVAMLSAIFIAGFLCLMNIQTPATFDAAGESSVVKKMQ